MNKNFKMYALIWTILLAGFSAVVFLAREFVPGFADKCDAGFWLAFAFIIAAFVGNLVCARYAFRTENLKKLFYKIPLISISYTAVFAMTAVSMAVMLIPKCPAWIAALVCAVILVFGAVAVVGAKWASDVVQKVDEKVETRTSFIYDLTVRAKSVLARAGNETVKSECRKVCDAVRYSDPVSSGGLSAIEAKIAVKMDEFSAAVEAVDEAKVKGLANEIVVLVGDRNKMCKAHK